MSEVVAAWSSRSVQVPAEQPETCHRLEGAGSQTAPVLGHDPGHGGRWPCGSPQAVQDRLDQPAGVPVAVGAEQVDALQICQRAPGADVALRNLAVIEPDRDEPGVTGTELAQLLDRERQLLVLVASLAAYAGPRKAGQEHDGIPGDRPIDLRSPVLAGTQSRVGQPDRDGGPLEHPNEPADASRVVPGTGDKRVPVRPG